MLEHPIAHTPQFWSFPPNVLPQNCLLTLSGLVLAEGPAGPAVARSVLDPETNTETDHTLGTQRRKGELAVPSFVPLPHSRRHFTLSHLGTFLVQSRETSRSSKMDEDSHRNKMVAE
uniref:Uncharacterized protein n=1 Tax=Timema poppense TaxID=170557 RepID=A0A7R9DGL0_TIMPO|nr:unnamed protein product [Timema poppensis]